MISNFSINSSKFQITHDDYLLFGALLVSKGTLQPIPYMPFLHLQAWTNWPPQKKIPSGVACWAF